VIAGDLQVIVLLNNRVRPAIQQEVELQRMTLDSEHTPPLVHHRNHLVDIFQLVCSDL
jgi:hypothetical protein